jgi:hypothetical protein
MVVAVPKPVAVEPSAGRRLASPTEPSSDRI